MPLNFQDKERDGHAIDSKFTGRLLSSGKAYESGERGSLSVTARPFLLVSSVFAGYPTKSSFRKATTNFGILFCQPKASIRSGSQSELARE